MSTRHNNGSHYENHQRAAELQRVPPTLTALPRMRTKSKITKSDGNTPGRLLSTPWLTSIPRGCTGTL